MPPRKLKIPIKTPPNISICVSFAPRDFLYPRCHLNFLQCSPATKRFSTRMVENTRRGGAGIHLSLAIFNYTDKKAKLINLPTKLLYHDFEEIVI